MPNPQEPSRIGGEINVKTISTRSTFWAFSVAAAFGLSAAYTRAGSEGTLLPAATPIPGTKGRAGQFFWIDNRRLITLQPKSGAYRPFEVDTDSGDAKPIPAIQSQYTQTELRNSWRLSPDGSRLLWGQQDGPRFRWIIHHLPTGRTFPQRYQPFDPYKRPTAAWVGADNDWAEITAHGPIYIAELHPQIYMARPLTGLSDPVQILHSDSPSRVTVAIRRPMSYWRGEMAQLDLLTGKVKKRTIPIPQRMAAMGLGLSPDATRLALTLWSQEPSSGFRLLGPLLSGFGIRDQRLGSLQVIDASDPAPREVGTVQWSGDRRRGRRAGPWLLKWTPDSRRISFAFRDQLYTIPAP